MDLQYLQFNITVAETPSSLDQLKTPFALDTMYEVDCQDTAFCLLAAPKLSFTL